MNQSDSTARVIAFDLDGTLAESKSPIADRMSALLTRLLDVVDVCIISGGAYEQFTKQVVDRLDREKTAFTRLHLMPTCGTRYYSWTAGTWRQVYAEDMSAQDKEHVIDVLTDGAKELGLWESEPAGEIIEDRGSQITFSALGQKASGDAKKAWDPDGSKKARLRDYAAAELPDLEVRSGGLTSIDVTGKGIDKAYGMRKLMSYLDMGMDDILFAGDRLDPDGNDHAVEAMGIRCVAVSNWQDTAGFIESLLDENPGAEGIVDVAAFRDRADGA